MFGISIEDMLGKPTIHLPINMIVQEASGNKYWGVWQCDHPDVHQLKFKSQAVHQLIIADCFIRPQIVLESNEFKGGGAANLARHGFAEIEKWSPIFQR